MQKLDIQQEIMRKALDALSLIAAPVRPDGTFNRSREACQQLAADTLAHIEALQAPKVAPTTSTRTYIAYSDGACKGNPGPAAWGIVVLNEELGLHRESGGYIGIATNQVAELQAAIEALSRTPAGCIVTLISDSQYVLKGISEWRAGWERSGFVNSKKEPVANQQYWKTLFALVDQRKVTVQWVKGHSGNKYNERCDAMANEVLVMAAMAR